MPKGTFLSNPSTAAAGSLGEGGALLPPTPQINAFSTPQVGFLSNNQPINLAASANVQRPPAARPVYPPYQGAVQAAQQAFAGELPVPPQYQQYVDAVNRSQNPQTPSPTGAFAPNSLSSTMPTNNLVGQSFDVMPSTLNFDTLKQILPGKTFEQIAQVMQAKGYEWVPYGGGFFANATESKDSTTLANNQVNALKDSRGRQQISPFALGPTLEPGERAVVSGGYGVTGGTPTEGGQAQYAVTMPGRGDRWKYNIQQDREGNWVRIYYRTNGRVNKRSMQNRQRRAQERGAASNVGGAREVNELVTLRANYG